VVLVALDTNFFAKCEVVYDKSLRLVLGMKWPECVSDLLAHLLRVDVEIALVLVGVKDVFLEKVQLFF
jgi:hypothetical protein